MQRSTYKELLVYRAWATCGHILQTVGFINEDDYCHSQRIGQLIKEKLLKGIFKVD